MRLSPVTKLIVIGLLVTLGIGLELSGLLKSADILETARGYSEHWWLMLIIVLVQAVMFTFALAGSLFLWIAAPLYPPLIATLLLTLGSTLGGLGAYFFSRYLTHDLKKRIEASRAYRILHGNNEFLALFAMRVLPGFPHSVVNYSAGLLRARLVSFVSAAILGIAIKTYIYARVIYGASNAMSVDMLFDISIYGPLILLALLAVAGIFVSNKLSARAARDDQR